MGRSENATGLGRRRFLRAAAALGGLAAASPFLEACARLGLIEPTATPAGTHLSQAASSTAAPLGEGAGPEPLQEAESTPSPAPGEGEGSTMGKIAFVKTDDRSEGVRRAIELLGINPLDGKEVFLKPNFNSAHPTPGSTHPQVLRALVLAMQQMGAQRITIGDRSGMGDTRRVMDQLGVFELAEEFDLETLVFDDLGPDGWVHRAPSGSHWRRGFLMAAACLQAEAVVQTCCLKTHRYGGHFTLSLKNSVGLVAKRDPSTKYDYMQELHTSRHQRRMIAEINAAYSPSLIVMDGVDAFVTGGPHEGKQVHSQVILAGTDRVAMDAVGVALLRHYGTTKQVSRGRIFEQEQIARAVELGLGVDEPQKIELLTGDPGSAAYAGQIREVLLSS